MSERESIISTSAMIGNEPIPYRSGIPGKTSVFEYHSQDHVGLPGMTKPVPGECAVFQQT